MSLTKYYGVEIECRHCGAKNPDNEIGINIRSANAYGASFRLFCHSCGWWTDVNAYLPIPRVNCFKPSEPSYRFKADNPDWKEKWSEGKGNGNE